MRPQRARNKKAYQGWKHTWLPDGYSQIFTLYVFGPLGYGPATQVAKFDPFLSSNCAPGPSPSNFAQFKERKGSNFVIWQHSTKVGSSRTKQLDHKCPAYVSIIENSQRSSFKKSTVTGCVAHNHVDNPTMKRVSWLAKRRKLFQ